MYPLLAVDGDGSSEIVGLFILAEETQSVIESAVTIFKRFNPRWTDTKVITSDKDFTERDAFKNCFPEASLNICLYHTLRSFRREITCDKLGITSAERLRCLELVSKLAYAKSNKEFDTHWAEIKATKLNSVIEYLELNWLPIKHQWVACFKDEGLNLGENTNNRLESLFSKIKSVCSKYASLLQFFHEFFSVLRTLRNERNHHYLMALARKPVENQHCDPGVQQYAQHLTPYAFQFVRTQMDLSNAIKTENVRRKPGETFEIKSSGDLITATPSSCTCSSAKRMGLPCRHILEVRDMMNLPLFQPTLVNQRWTMAYYEELAETRFSCDNSTQLDQSHTTVTLTENKQTVLFQAQKFRKALRIAQSLASLASEGGMRTFTTRLRQLEDVAEYWSLGREVTISAQRDSHSAAGKQDPQDKESGRTIKRKRNEKETEGKEQKQENASERKGQETNDGQSVEKKARTEAEGQGRKTEMYEERESKKMAQEISKERKRRETHVKSKGKKIKNDSGGNEEKLKTDGGEQEKWTTGESQEQEVKEKKKQHTAQKETKGMKEKRGIKDIKSQTHGVKGTEKEQEVHGESEELRKTRHETKDAECEQESDDAFGKTGQHLNGRNGLTKEASECTPTSGFRDIKMPPKIMKRGRPKGAELTVVGIPKTKKRKVEGPILLPYKKLKPYDKERMILECVTKKRIVVAEALSGKRLLDNDDIQTNIHLIPDTVRDRDNIDIFRFEKFFTEETWFQILEILQRKEESAWYCKACSKAVKDNQESIACDRCLLWYHFSCSSLSSKPKARNWFCKTCKNKFN